MEKLNKNEYYLRLKEVGGHKIHHREGSADIHTQLVFLQMCYLTDDTFMWKVALLHDIGKVENIADNEGRSFDDWKYPHHSDRGAFVSLPQVIDRSDPDYKRYEWYILNHMQPLFWKTEEGFQKWCEKNPCPEGCSYKSLALLGVADLEGSLMNPDHQYDEIREGNKKN